MNVRRLFAGLVCSAVLSVPAKAEAPGECVGHYWFDQSESTGIFNPGSFEIDVSGLPVGLHTLNVRIECDGAPAALASRLFLKPKEAESDEKYTVRVLVDNKLISEKEHDVLSQTLVSLDLDLKNLAEGIHGLSVVVFDRYGLVGSKDSYFLKVPTADQYSGLQPCWLLDGKRIDLSTGMLGASNTYSVELDMSALASGLHALTAYFVSPAGLMTSAHTAWFVKIPSGGEGVRKYRYWINDDPVSVKAVELSETANPFSLVELVDVGKYDIKSSCYGFYIENGVPMVCARNKFRFMSLDGDSRTNLSESVYDDQRVARAVSGIEHIAANAVTKVTGADNNNIRWYSFDGLPGDSIGLTLSRGAMFELYAPDGAPLMEKTGADVVKYNSAILRQEGIYYFAVHDVVESSDVDIDFVHVPRYAVLDATPGRSANIGRLVMTVTGNGFDKLSTLALKSAAGERQADYFEVIDNYRLKALFDLDNIPLQVGSYDLVCNFSDSGTGISEIATAPESILIEDAEPVEIAVEIECPRIASTPYLAYIHVTNRSNVGCWGIPFNIAVKATENESQVDFIDFGFAVSKDAPAEGYQVIYKTQNLLGSGEPGVFVPAVIPFLSAGESLTLTVGVTAAPHQKLTFYAWAGQPWSEESREMLSPDYDLDQILTPSGSNLLSLRDIANLIYTCLTTSETESSSYGMLKAPQAPPPSTGDVANAAVNTAKVGLSIGGHGGSHILNLSLRGDQAVLEACGFDPSNMDSAPSALTDKMNTTNNMLAVGQDIVNAGSTSDGLIGAIESLGHLLQARQNWQNAVNPQPNPSPSEVENLASGDPNEIKGYIAPSGSNYVGIGVKTIGYDIEFENDPAIANASATRIVVKSTIDTRSLDAATLRPQKLILGQKELELPASHHFVKTLDMRPEINSVAELTFDFNSDSGDIVWSLRSLDPMTMEETKYVDDGILPVNDDTGRGTGHLTYSVDLRPTVTDGDEFKACAEIVFDDNEPIVTNVWSNLADYVLPEAVVSVEIAEDNMNCHVAISGSDSGSGIWYYDVYAFKPGDTEWKLIRGGICDDSFDYVSETSLENACFLVVPSDMAGNRNSSGLLITIGDADGNGIVDATDVVVIRNYYTGEVESILPVNADVNRDSAIDSQDALSTINIYLDKNPEKATLKRIRRQK